MTKLVSHGQNLKTKMSCHSSITLQTQEEWTRTFSHKLYKSQNPVVSHQNCHQGVTVLGHLSTLLLTRLAETEPKSQPRTCEMSLCHFGALDGWVLKAVVGEAGEL